MAVSAANVLIGACTVSVGAYVSSGGTLTVTDVGHTNGPVTWTAEHTNAEVLSERQMGPVKIVPTAMKIKVKVPMLEVTAQNLAVALKQASGTGGLTSGTNTASLYVNDPQEQYKAITLNGPSPFSAAGRTVTFWKCMVESVSEIAMAKGAPSVCELVFSVLCDTTCATTQGQYFKIVDV